MHLNGIYLILMPFNLPNVLTWMRILAIPLFVGIFYFPSTWLSQSEQNLISTIIFTVAAITDWLDGYLAQSTPPDFGFRRIP